MERYRPALIGIVPTRTHTRTQFLEGTVKAKITQTFLRDHLTRLIQDSGGRIELYDTTVPGLILRAGQRSQAWYLMYTNRQGKRSRYKMGTIKQFNATQAKEEARRLQTQIADGSDPSGEKAQQKVDARLAASRTLKAFLEGEYWDKKLCHAPSGAATKGRLLAAWKPILDTDMVTLTISAVETHRAGRLKEGLKPATLNRDRVALIATLNKALEWGIIESNPLKLWKPLKLDDANRVRYLGQRDEQEATQDDAGHKVGERERFLDALGRQPQYIQAIVTLALNTGMRRGEILNLRWTDISLQRREILLRSETTKARTQRHVPLNAVAMSALEAWKAGQGTVVNIQGYIFPGPTDGPMFSIKKAWATLCRCAQVAEFRLHDCRHDFCSRLVMAGVDLYVVRDLAGHSSITLTERYAHLAPKKTRAAVEMLQ